MRALHFACAIVVLLCTVVVAAAQTVTPPPADRLVAQARQAMTAGRVDEAAALADQALAIAPRNRDAVSVKIQAAFALGKPPDAFRAYDAFVTRPADHDIQLLALLSKGLLVAAAGVAGPSPDLGIEARYRLARSGDAAARQDLERKLSLGGSDSQVLPLLTALARLGDPKAGGWFADQVRQSSGGDQVEAIRTLVRLKLTAQAGVLVDLLGSDDPNVRAVAAGALGSLEYRAALPRLRELLADAVPAVRMFAAMAVKRLGDPSADAQVAGFLQSPVPELRLVAAEAYQTSKTTEWVPLVRELLGEPSVMTRIRAAELLACCDQANARVALAATVDRGNPLERHEAARVLEDKGLADPPLIRRLLGDDDAWIRTYAAGAALVAASAAPPKQAAPVR